MHPMYVIRAVGGAMYLAGFLILVVNVWATLAGRVRVEKPMTETRHNAAAERPLAPVPAQSGALVMATQPAAKRLSHTTHERNVPLLGCFSLLAVAHCGIPQIALLFSLDHK